MLLISYAMSDVGRKRAHNEDSFYADDSLGLYIVADGVGGESRGEVASREAVENLQCWILRHREVIDQFYAAPDNNIVFQLRRMLESGIQSACYVVFGLAQQFAPGTRMATTLSAALFLDNQLFIGQVGDSRIYRLREGETIQLTEDHTLLNYELKRGIITPQQAKGAHRKRGVITRAVGHFDYVDVDVLNCTVEPGDRYLLCSDGLHGYLKDYEEIAEILSDDLPTVPGRFIELANSRGGKDNITAIALELL